MLTLVYPNSEVEILSSEIKRVNRVDSHRVRPHLDIKFPVPTESKSRLKTRSTAGFGRLHCGKGHFRRGTKRRVERLGGAMDSYASQTGLVRVFITLTCPGSSRRAVEAFSAWSGYILNALNDWIQRRQERGSGRRGICRLHVWELQKRGAEHVHYCVCLSRDVFEAVRRDIRGWFHLLLERVSDMSLVDIFERANGEGSWKGRPEVLQLKVVEVEKSVSAYMSKYLVKDMGSQARGFSVFLIPRPARLWGASRFLKRFLSANITSLFWNLSLQDRSECLSLIQDYLLQKSMKFSIHCFHGGLTIRMRLFFSGNSLALKDTVAGIEAIIDRFEVVKSCRLSDGGGLVNAYKKAIRVMDSNSKRVLFHDLYGGEVMRYLVNFRNQVPQSSFVTSIVVTCLEDFDEVGMKSLRELQQEKKPKDVSMAQTVLKLFD